MENQIIPLLRRSKLDGELEKIKKMKEEGKTKEEVLRLIDRRIVITEDVEEIFKDEQEDKVEVEKMKQLETEEIVKIEQQEESGGLNQKELEEAISNDENFYTEDDILKVEEDNGSIAEILEEQKNEQNKEIEKFIKNEEDSKIEKVIEEKKDLEQEKEEFKYLKDEELEDFPNQPFKLYNEEKKEEMIQSIKINGIIQSLIVRPIGDKKYQILAGHNRRMCGREAGLKEFPCKIKYGLTDDEAKLIMVDTNFATREQLSPMEKAKALLIRKNVYRTEKIRSKIEKGILGDNLETIDVRERLKAIENMSDGNLQRYLRLNYLDESLQNLVEEGKLSLKVAENLSFIGKPYQRTIANMIQKDNLKISETQSKQLKNEENLSKDKILDIFQKKEQLKKTDEISIIFKRTEIESFFDNFEPENIKKKILSALQTLGYKL